MDDLDYKIMDIINADGGTYAYRCTEIIRGDRPTTDNRREWNSTYLRVLSHLRSLNRYGFLDAEKDNNRIMYFLPEN